jgi:hypothetical protein
MIWWITINSHQHRSFPSDTRFSVAATPRRLARIAPDGADNATQTAAYAGLLGFAARALSGGSTSRNFTAQRPVARHKTHSQCDFLDSPHWPLAWSHSHA